MTNSYVDEVFLLERNSDYSYVRLSDGWETMMSTRYLVTIAETETSQKNFND